MQTEIDHDPHGHANQIPAAKVRGVYKRILSKKQDRLNSCNGTRAKDVLGVLQSLCYESQRSLVTLITVSVRYRRRGDGKNHA